MKLLTVLLPCFNEADGLPLWEAELFPALERLGRPYEVLAVDDGSTDGTAAALAAMAARRPALRAARHERNRGLGAALRTGLREARGEWICCLDADLTFHPEHIPALVAEAERSGADCVSGSPFLAAGGEVPLSRRLPSLLLNTFYRGLLDRRLTSFTPMFRLYRTEPLRALSLRSEGFEISVEILAGLLRAGRRVREVPVPLLTRRAGASKLRHLRELRRHLALMLRLLLL